MASHDTPTSHLLLTRRAALQAGSIGLLGLGLPELSALRALGASDQPRPKKSVIFVFLTGGLSHQDSFDLKPDAPDSVRGGATDKIAADPTVGRQTPENVAATIYQTLGIPRTTIWKDVDGRPYELYRGEPMADLM